MMNPNTETTNWRFYLIPLDRVRFGVEQDPDRQDYLVKSRAWPQQTALLGLLRYELLRSNGLLLKPGEKWVQGHGKIDALIGKASFDGQQLSHGVIREIGPASVCKFDQTRESFSNENLVEDFFYRSGAIKPTKLFFPTINLREGLSKLCQDLKVRVSYGGSPEDAWIFDNYNVKVNKPNDLLLTSLDGGENIPLYSHESINNTFDLESKRQGSKGVFVSVRTAGVTKDYTGQLDEEQKQGHYYVAESYSMHSDFGFSFTAFISSQTEVSEGLNYFVPDWSKTRLVRFGSDGYPWILWGEKEFILADPPEGNGSNFLLLTDARVSREIFDWSNAVVGDVEHFRNQQKKTAQKFYHHSTHSVLDESESVNDSFHSSALLKRGTVIWVKPEYSGNVSKMLKEQFKPWHNIGYNRFVRFDESDSIN